MEHFDFIKYFSAFIVVIGSILAGSWVLRRLNLSRLIEGASGKKRRMRIAEVLPLDTRNKLVMVRIDEQDHIILLTQNGGNIISNQISMQQQMQTLQHDNM